MVSPPHTLRRTLAACAALALSVLRADEAPVASPGWQSAHAALEALWLDFAPEWITDDYELVPAARLQAWFQPLPPPPPAVRPVRPRPVDYASLLREELARTDAPRPVRPTPLRDAGAIERHVPDYEHWLGRMGKSRRPHRATDYLTIARAAFAAEGVPGALVWLAETESSFNPVALSPVGARGLFQLMPATACALGLTIFPIDQRTNPEASAAAAAVYLRYLHGRFGDWALALAAYNAGEGLVSRTLRAEQATSFAAIAERLPKETRAYVPRVLATVRVRAGVSPDELAKPRPRN